MYQNYWENYYKAHQNPSEASLFATFVWNEYLSQDSKKKALLELGCGNGRDSVFFAQKGINVIAIDQAKSEIAFLQSHFNTQDNLTFMQGDFTKLPYFELPQMDCIYSRFTLHSIKKVEQERLLRDCLALLKEDGILCIEARGEKNALFGMGEAVSDEANAFIYDNHYRRFLNLKQIVREIESVLCPSHICHSQAFKDSCEAESWVDSQSCHVEPIGETSHQPIAQSATQSRPLRGADSQNLESNQDSIKSTIKDTSFASQTQHDKSRDSESCEDSKETLDSKNIEMDYFAFARNDDVDSQKSAPCHTEPPRSKGEVSHTCGDLKDSTNRDVSLVSQAQYDKDSQNIESQADSKTARNVESKDVQAEGFLGDFKGCEETSNEVELDVHRGSEFQISLESGKKPTPTLTSSGGGGGRYPTTSLKSISARSKKASHRLKTRTTILLESSPKRAKCEHWASSNHFTDFENFEGYTEGFYKVVGCIRNRRRFAPASQTSSLASPPKFPQNSKSNTAARAKALALNLRMLDSCITESCSLQGTRIADSCITESANFSQDTINPNPYLKVPKATARTKLLLTRKSRRGNLRMRGDRLESQADSIFCHTEKVRSTTKNAESAPSSEIHFCYVNINEKHEAQTLKVSSECGIYKGAESINETNFAFVVNETNSSFKLLSLTEKEYFLDSQTCHIDGDKPKISHTYSINFTTSDFLYCANIQNDKNIESNIHRHLLQRRAYA